MLTAMTAASIQCPLLNECLTRLQQHAITVRTTLQYMGHVNEFALWLREQNIVLSVKTSEELRQRLGALVRE